MTDTASAGPEVATTERMVRLVTSIARLLADAPDQVSVEAAEETGTVLLRLTSAPGDVGKLVGQQGRTARSLRTLLTAASANSSLRYTLDIVEPR